MAALIGLTIGLLIGFALGIVFAVVQDSKIQPESEKRVMKILLADEVYTGLIPRASIITKCLEVMKTTHNVYCYDTAVEILEYTLDVSAVDKENKDES